MNNDSDSYPHGWLSLLYYIYNKEWNGKLFFLKTKTRDNPAPQKNNKNSRAEERE